MTSTLKHVLIVLTGVFAVATTAGVLYWQRHLGGEAVVGGGLPSSDSAVELPPPLFEKLPLPAPSPPPTRQQGMVPPHSDPLYPVTQPRYPRPTEGGAWHEGTVVLLLTVSARGFVTDAKVSTSSGHGDLDEAAIAEAKRAWRFKPGTVNGRPMRMQYKFRVVFKHEGN